MIMLRLPRHPLRGWQRQLKLPHTLPHNPHPTLIQPSPLIPPRRPLHPPTRIPHMIVTRQLIPVEDGQLHLEHALVLVHMEEELLVPDWVEGVSDDVSAENFVCRRR